MSGSITNPDSAASFLLGDLGGFERLVVGLEMFVSD